MSFTIGQQVGAYKIIAPLGQGGMAAVFKAYHAALDRYVAIKVMHPVFREDPGFVQRFNREARIVARLEHPNIVPVYDYAEQQGLAYLVMRFVEGETLKARLKRGPLRAAQIIEVADKAGRALGYAHQKGVLHRDIKPSNFLLCDDPQDPEALGEVFLTDFGLARVVALGESTLSRDVMIGTPQYISPEQAKGVQDLDARTDIYSLGVVLFEMVTGRVPFSADTPYSIIHDHIFTPLPLPRSINPNVPEPVERVLLKALAKEREDRFQDVESFVNAFAGAVRSSLQRADFSSVVPEVPEAIPTPPSGGSRPKPFLPESEAEETHAPGPAGTGSEKKPRRWPWILALVLLLTCLCLSTLWCLSSDLWYELGIMY